MSRIAVPVLGLLVVCLFFTAEGLLVGGPACYNCHNIADPLDCHSVTQCNSGQTCYTERTAGNHNTTQYTLGCRNVATCDHVVLVGRKRESEHARDVTRRAAVSCSQCCQEDFCNKDICHIGASSAGSSIPASSSTYVRLINGANAYEGTVQVYHAGEWGSICDNSWSGNDASVVCRMLGYRDEGVGAVSGSVYRPANDQSRIWLTDMQCTGTENSLNDCPKSSWGSVGNCTHQEDAAVICPAVSPTDDVVYLLDTGLGGVLVRMNLLTQSYVPIPLSGVYHAVTFDYDPEYGRLYFYDQNLRQFVSVHFDGKDEREIRTLTVDSQVQKLEVDPLNRMLFFSDDGRNVISSMNLDGSNFHDVITTGLDRPREVVLDPRNRKVYWTDWGSSPKIEVANYDGTGRQTLVSTGIQWPNGMAIDYNENKLYFVDGATQNMEVVDLQGGNRHVIMHDATARFYSLDVFDNFIYYTDWSRTTLMRINKDGTGKTPVGAPSFRQLADIRVHEYGTDVPGVTTASPVHFDPSHVFVRVHGPATLGYVEVYVNGQWGTVCSDHWDDQDAAVVCRMVGLSGTGAQAATNGLAGHGNFLIYLDEVSCAGTEQHILDCPGVDSTTIGHHNCNHGQDAGVICTRDNNENNFMLFASGGLLNRMSLSTYSYTVVPILSDLPNPIAVEYNPNNNKVYYSVVVQNPGSMIYSEDLDGQDPHLIKQLPNNSVVDGLAIDTVNNRIYFTDAGSDVISSMALDGSDVKAVISSGLDQPRAIVVDPQNRVIYWTDWGSSPKIERANYDGSNRQTIVFTNLKLPNGLELDTKTHTLYFCDAGTHLIESVSTDGSNRQIVFTDYSAHFFDLFLTDKYIYYSDWNRGGVLRLNRDGTNQQMVGPPSFQRISGIAGSFTAGN